MHVCSKHEHLMVLLADELAACAAAHVWHVVTATPAAGRSGCPLHEGVELDSVFQALSLGCRCQHVPDKRYPTVLSAGLCCIRAAFQPLQFDTIVFSASSGSARATAQLSHNWLLQPRAVPVWTDLGWSCCQVAEGAVELSCQQQLGRPPVPSANK
jgi:hypothetical protein